jgi:hypothetical protein
VAIPLAAQPQLFVQGSCAATKNILATAIRGEHAARAMGQINEDLEHTNQTLGRVLPGYHFKA